MLSKVIYRHRNRSRWFHIGDAKAIGLADARTKAAELMLAVVRDGKDPAAEKRIGSEATTFGVLASRDREEHAKKRNKSYRQADALVRRSFASQRGASKMQVRYQPRRCPRRAWQDRCGDTKERDAIIADAEGRSATLMRRLGAKAGTQNIDRILRLPGTINLPNAKKLKVGRVPCPTKLLAFNGGGYPLELFVPGTPEDGGHHARQQEHDEGRGAIDVDALPVSDRIKNFIRGIERS